jgi:predicted MPP superfamily phosphohydrolase
MKDFLNFCGFILLVTITIVIFFSFSFNKSNATINVTAINLLLLDSSSSNSSLLFADGKHNIIAAGDWTCNSESQRTIDNVLELNPDLIITAGDHVRNVPSADCWIAMSAKIKDKMKIAIGNHDVEFEKTYKEFVNYHGLKNPYYSHDFQNIHFISLSTEHPFGDKSPQYDFIKNDLDKTSKNPAIDWIVVHQHKPMYSTNTDKAQAEKLRNLYHQLFQEYDVDLVISGHNQYYERTYPILHNETDKWTSNGFDIPDPIIAADHKSEYLPTNGIIFLSVGTAGDKLHPVRETHDYHVIQESQHGFLNLELSSQGKILEGQFYNNDGNVLDNFVLYER